jgi:hypothetical protein
MAKNTSGVLGSFLGDNSTILFFILVFLILFSGFGGHDCDC